VTNDNSAEALTVEIDLNNDGTADASTETDADGNFGYTPTDLDFGQRTVKARAIEWDAVVSQYLNGPWKSLTFTLNVDPSLLPVIADLALDNDTGESDSDGETEDPTLKGQITAGLGAGAVDVEFDHDGDGVANGSTVTDGDGNFLYEPFGLANGPVTVYARGKSWNESPVLEELSLFEDTGDPEDAITSNHTLTGFVSDDKLLAGLTVQFDHNGDGVVDGSAATLSNGTFVYIPSGLPTGTEVREHHGPDHQQQHAGGKSVPRQRCRPSHAPVRS
jgi:hypothetical protein